MVDSYHRLVGGDLNNIKIVYLSEFFLLGERSSRHSRKFIIHSEIILECYCRKRLVLLLYLDALFCLYRLMKSVRETSAVHHTSREFIDDYNAFIGYNILLIAEHSPVRLDGLIYVMHKFGVFGIGGILDSEKLLCLSRSARCKNCPSCLFINHIIGIYIIKFFLAVHLLDDEFLQRTREFVCSVVHIGRLIARTRYNKRGSRLVYQNRVNLVDDGKAVSSLNHTLLVNDHIVTQIVKTEFVVRTVSYICIVRNSLIVVFHTRNDKSGAESHKGVNSAHFVPSAFCKIVVDRDDMNSLPCECVEVCRKSGDKRLSFTGFHLGNSSLMKDDTAYQLNMEWAFAEHSVICLSHRRKGIGKYIIECLTRSKTFFEPRCYCLKFRIAHCGIFVSQFLNFACNFLDFLYLFFAVRFKKTHCILRFFYKSAHIFTL